MYNEEKSNPEARMKSVRQFIALALLICFEIAAGVLLLIDPEKVAHVILFLFGIVMIVIGGMNLVRFYKEKPEGLNGFITCMVGVASLLVGIFSVIPATRGMMMEYRTIFYALIFFVAGLYEAQMYFTSRQTGAAVSVMLLISAVTAIVFGVLVAVNHNGALVSFLDKDQLPAVFMFCQALTDLIALILAIRKVRNGGKKNDDKPLDITPAP